MMEGLRIVARVGFFRFVGVPFFFGTKNNTQGFSRGRPLGFPLNMKLFQVVKNSWKFGIFFEELYLAAIPAIKGSLVVP